MFLTTQRYDAAEAAHRQICAAFIIAKKGERAGDDCLSIPYIEEGYVVQVILILAPCQQRILKRLL